MFTTTECPICTETGFEAFMILGPCQDPELRYVGPHCERCHLKIEDEYVLKVEDTHMYEIHAGIIDKIQLTHFRNWVQRERKKGKKPLRNVFKK